MNPTTNRQEKVLQMRRIFFAPRERVFDAWVEPAALQHWFHPSPDMTSPEVSVDLREGGKYSIVMENAEGRRHNVAGTYRQIKRPEKLVFTWQWQAEEPTPETLVTVELFEIADGATELVLTHTQFPTQEGRDRHAIGWEGTLSQLFSFMMRTAPQKESA